MSLEGTQAPHLVGEDFGLAGHLATIERMHRDALAQLDALARPWGNLWSAQPEVGPVAERPRRAARHQHAAHAAAA